MKPWLAGLTALALSANLLAQSYPSKPVRIIVGFPPGGASDGSARLLAEGLSAEWKQPVIVENRPGVGTTIAAAHVAAAPPDGYTLLHIAPGTHAVASAVYKNLSYDAVKSFAGVGQLMVAPFVVVVNASSKVSSMRELIEAARARPGQLTYSSSGSGAGPHLVSEMIALATGVKFVHIPFKGSAPATLALLAGQVDFSVAESSAIPHIQSGKLRGLAVSSATPSRLFGGVPTLPEAGVQDVEYVLVHGIVAPAGTPREVILKASGAVARVVATEDFRRRMHGLGLEPATRSAEEFDAFLAAEVRKYTKLAQDIGLKLE